MYALIRDTDSDRHTLMLEAVLARFAARLGWTANTELTIRSAAGRGTTINEMDAATECGDEVRLSLAGLEAIVRRPDGWFDDLVVVHHGNAIGVLDSGAVFVEADDATVLDTVAQFQQVETFVGSLVRAGTMLDSTEG